MNAAIMTISCIEDHSDSGSASRPILKECHSKPRVFFMQESFVEIDRTVLKRE